MIREALSLAVQKKFFLMFFTCVIYITGLFAYFSGHAIVIAFVLLVLGIFAIFRNYLSPKLVLFWYFMFFFAFFNASLRIKNYDALYQIAPQEATIEGQIISIPIDRGAVSQFFFNVSKVNFKVKSESVNAKTLVSTYKSDNYNIGDYYRFSGKLRTPFNPTNPSQFDYGKYLRNYKVYTLFYKDGEISNKLKIKLPLRWKFLQGLNNVRNDIIQAHSKCLKSPNLELLGGIVFGDDAIAPTDELKTSFQHSGLLHLLAASGMNVALIYGIWFYILRKLKAPFNLSVISGIFVIIFYSLMTGLGPSVVRAAIMLIFVLIGKLIDRDAHSISLLSFVALLMLIYNPAYINDVGFQLSFLVTFGLLVMAPIVFEGVNAIPNWLKGTIFIPVIAQIWVAPIQMYYFNSFSLYSVFANIITVPFVTVISFGGFISAVLALIKPLANQICFVFDLILNPFLTAVVAVSNYFANLPHSLVQMPQPSEFQIFLYYSVVLFITALLKFGKNKKIIIATSILFVALIVSLIKIPDRKLTTVFFDVQNADAIMIKTPLNKYFLIDSGKMPYKGGKTQSQMIILSYLKDIGVKNIEGLIITHFDSDHAGGAVKLIENLGVKCIYVNSLGDKSNLAQKIYKSGKCKLKLAKNNEIIYKEGDLTIKNFVNHFAGKDSDNENSIITLVSKSDFDELFMGDAGIDAFEKIKNYLPQKIEVLKVGHHGAKNVVNKEFLDRINPEVALISTGINNYGHPNGVTLNLLESHKVKTFRTDRQNAIKIDYVRGKSFVYSYLQGKFKCIYP